MTPENYEQLLELQRRLDPLVIRLLLPLRMTKQVDEPAFTKVAALLDEFRTVISEEDLVPRRLMGNLFLILSSLLTEARYAKDPAQRRRIEDAAWSLDDRLRKVLDPKADLRKDRAVT